MPLMMKVAAAVESISGIVGAGVEGDAIAGADRQFAGARDRGARVRIDVDGSALRPGGPGADGQRAEGDAARQRQPSRAEADGGGEFEREK